MGEIDTLVVVTAQRIYDWCYCIDLLWWIRR